MKIEQTENTRHVTITAKAQEQILEFIGKYPAERGGILGADADGVIRHFAPDPTARCTAGAYDPDINAMNQQIKKWKGENIDFAGFVHSHPPGYKQLSGADEEYATKILGAFKSLNRLCLPLAMTVPDYGKFELIPFVALRNAKNQNEVIFERAEIVIEPDAAKSPQAAPSSEQTVKAEQQTSVIDATSDVGWVKWRYYGNFPSAWREPNLRKRGQSDKGRVKTSERTRS